MAAVFSAFLFLLVVFAVLKRSHAILFYLCVVSLFADGIGFDYGISISLAQMVGFLVLPMVVINRMYADKALSSLIWPLYIEFFYLCVLGVLLGILFPWQDMSGTRMWSQTSGGRALVSLARLANDFIVLFYIYWLIKTGRATFKMFAYCVACITSLSLWVGLIDFKTGYQVARNIFGGHEAVFDTGRVVGLNGEPKALGRSAALAFGILLIYAQSYRANLLIFFGLLSNVIAVLVSLSATAIVMFTVITSFLFVYNFRPVYVLFSILIVAIFLVFLGTSEFFFEITYPKILRAFTGEDYSWWGQPFVIGEPAFFSRFDIFDRLALIFLWENPLYAFFGTGPNLISIPASIYVPEQTGFYLLGRIDSVPNFMINNILARSGFIGLFLYLVAVIKVLNGINTRNGRVPVALLVVTLVYSFIYFDSVMAAMLGVALGLAQVAKGRLQGSKDQYAEESRV